MFANRIVFLPVDERFCTRDYFLLLARAANIDVVTPPKVYLGAKKTPPDLRRLSKWLKETALPGDYLVISVDMLVHGGLIPSRISLDTLDTLIERLGLLEELKKLDVKIYATTTITRTPFYNSSEEEPDYWQYFGLDMYDLSRLLARSFRGEMVHRSMIEKIGKIPSHFVTDYLVRRIRNRKLVSSVIELVDKGVIDFLNLVLDDNSKESISLAESEIHRAMVDSLKIGSRVSIHAGADEATLSLLARVLSESVGEIPTFEVHYASPEHKDFIPPYEGSPLYQGIQNHIEAAGGKVVDSAGEILLLANNPEAGLDSAQQLSAPTDLSSYERFFREIEAADSIIKGIADVKYTNGADNYLVEELLKRSELNWLETNYSAWNTAGNTLGTVCAHSIVQLLGSKGLLKVDQSRIKKLQAIFFLEHWAFQSNIRKRLLVEAEKRGSKPWTVIPVESWAEGFVRSELTPYIPPVQDALEMEFEIERLFFPWHRSFELGLSIVQKDEPRGD
ncbi:hypothetical protein Y696_10795 [Mesotoga sp. H07pep.5.4]|uniref:DUF4127 family protein n=1 Tax=Mesotoga sp. H07pep.5.4 TaxID=1463664 RepID=UPI000EF169A4|nr:DUF4127 family protein [Mesotoga sp. H07pep.5.4]RLL83121.1 hypothetical protein Y696_10795 [Mesotoga sp. H07pep.5.4]